MNSAKLGLIFLGLLVAGLVYVNLSGAAALADARAEQEQQRHRESQLEGLCVRLAAHTPRGELLALINATSPGALMKETPSGVEADGLVFRFDGGTLAAIGRLGEFEEDTTGTRQPADSGMK